MKRSAVASVARGALAVGGMACALLVPGGAQATDVCALLRQHAPKEYGLVLEKSESVTPEFCQAWSADRKNTLLLRVMSASNVSMYLAGMRQSAVNSGNGKVADEQGLGAGAFSSLDERGIEITFGAGKSLVMVVMSRDTGFRDADAAAGRAFARAIAGALK